MDKKTDKRTKINKRKLRTFLKKQANERKIR